MNQSDEDRRVRLLIHDGGKTVVDERLDLPAGGKGRTKGLVTKRGVYPTELRPDDGPAKAVEWHVDGSNGDLQLMVETSGELSVATASLR